MKDIYNYKEYKDRAFYLIRQEYGAHTVKTISVPIDNDKSMEGICLHLGTNSVSPIIYFHFLLKWIWKHKKYSRKYKSSQV